MALGVKIDLEATSGTWTSLGRWAIYFKGFSGRKQGLDPHRAGFGKLTLRVSQGDTTLPSALGGIASPATAQGDRVRVLLTIGNTDYPIWIGWIDTVRWVAHEVIHIVEVKLVDALGLLGALQVTFNPIDHGRELCGRRIQSILDEANWTWGATVPDGQSQCDNRDEEFRGSTAEIVQRTALSEPGLVVAKPSLTKPLEFLERGYTPKNSLRISDRPTVPGVRWNRRPEPESAQDQLVNQVAFTIPSDRDGDITQDDDSVAAYGVRRIDRAYELTSTEGLTVARATIQTNKAPITMPRRGRIALHLEPEARAALAAQTTLGDLAEMVLTDTDDSIVASQGLIDGIGWEVRPLGRKLAADMDLWFIPTFGASVPQVVAIPGLADLQAAIRTSWEEFLPPATGGTGDGFTYTLTGRPSWMSFDATRRRIYGAVPITGGPWSLTYTATDVTDTSRSASRQFDVSRYVPPIRLGDPPNMTFATGAAVSAVLPAATGGSSSFTYALTGRPSWLSFNASTRTMSGNAPNSAAAAVTLTYKATDSRVSGSATQTFTITVVVNPVDMAAITGQSIAAGVAYARTLPAATGGSGRGFAYALTGKPSWMTLTGRDLSGTPGWADATINLTWRATDRGSGQVVSRQWQLRVTVPALTMGAQDKVTIAAGEALSVNLPLAGGGSGSFTYTLSGKPAWVARTGNRLTGTAPGTASSANLAWSARDTNTGRTVSRSFALAVVVNPVEMVAIANIQLGVRDTLSGALPAATGGSGSITYALTGAPSWVQRSGFALSGTAPSAIATSTLKWTATDTVTGLSASRSFSLAVTGIALAAPTVAVTNITGTSFRIEWAAVTNAGSYEYRYAAGAAPTGAWTAASATAVDVTGLASETEYHVEVRAIGAGQYVTSVAGTQMATTLSAAALLGAMLGPGRFNFRSTPPTRTLVLVVLLPAGVDGWQYRTSAGSWSDGPISEVRGNRIGRKNLIFADRSKPDFVTVRPVVGGTPGAEQTAYAYYATAVDSVGAISGAKSVSLGRLGRRVTFTAPSDVQVWWFFGYFNATGLLPYTSAIHPDGGTSASIDVLYQSTNSGFVCAAAATTGLVPGVQTFTIT